MSSSKLRTHNCRLQQNISALALLMAQVSQVKIQCKNKCDSNSSRASMQPTPAKPQQLTEHHQFQSSVNLLYVIEKELKARLLMLTLNDTETLLKWRQCGVTVMLSYNTINMPFKAVFTKKLVSWWPRLYMSNYCRCRSPLKETTGVQSACEVDYIHHPQVQALDFPLSRLIVTLIWHHMHPFISTLSRWSCS